MKVAFLTEMGFEGKIPFHHSNMRTEFAWMHALDAEHRHIHFYEEVRDYDHVFVIFPKGKVFLSAEGTRIVEDTNPVSHLLQSSFIAQLKQTNAKVYYVQEGPHWWFNDYELADQIGFYNMLASCDAIFAHNESDTPYYRGLFPGKPVHILPSLMIEGTIGDIEPLAEEKVIIGGNFARWYGGFESFTVAQEFEVPIWGQTSHAKRDSEDQLIQHLPRVLWTDWIAQLSTFKYAVHLMPTVAAGTFSLNCAYLGIPCIGNSDVDTQRLCHPNLSVKVSNVEEARKLAQRLTSDEEFYILCSNTAKENYKKHFTIGSFKQKLSTILNT
jgi:hypothetical protein